jgi:hypothetical protein
MQAFQQADESLRQVEQSMHFPVEELFAKAKFYDESPEFLICVCSVHVLSRIFAEASKNQIVPGSFSPVFGGPPGLQHNSEGMVVLEQSLKFTELLQQLLANGLDVTRLWHVTGYVAFIAARVFLVRISGEHTFHPKIPLADLFLVLLPVERVRNRLATGSRSRLRGNENLPDCTRNLEYILETSKVTGMLVSLLRSST